MTTLELKYMAHEYFYTLKRFNIYSNEEYADIYDTKWDYLDRMEWGNIRKGAL